MEWIGGGFVLTIGGVRLRVRIALEDTPDARVPARDATGDAWEAAPAPLARERRPDNASSMN